MDNYHYTFERQRYAYDIVQNINDFTYTGDPLNNEVITTPFTQGEI
ncbi:hypothetical protein [Paenibacillus sp. IHBB 10380]|nr:hypothetical protein [Paenibacillus sp. IHBB 10380]